MRPSPISGCSTIQRTSVRVRTKQLVLVFNCQHLRNASALVAMDLSLMQVAQNACHNPLIESAQKVFGFPFYFPLIRFQSLLIFLGQFMCIFNQRCIDLSYLCDGDDDCGDGSDELYHTDHPCEDNKNCENGFLCDGTRCLKMSTVCDGVVNCDDGSDEGPVECPHKTCAANSFACKDSGKCIPESWVCDSHMDCKDGSDEAANCTVCPEFQCNNKVCVPSEQLCDGVNNCG